jgi:hypothetical protein
MPLLLWRTCSRVTNTLPNTLSRFYCPTLAAGGQYQGRIRSLCQFFNTTDLLLEVALLQDDDTAWTLLPTTASQGPLQSGSKANLGEVVEEEVFEYERYLPLRGWSPNHLSSLDPRQFSRYRSGAHSSSNFPRVPLPAVSAVLWSMAGAEHCPDSVLDFCGYQAWSHMRLSYYACL